MRPPTDAWRLKNNTLMVRLWGIRRYLLEMIKMRPIRITPIMEKRQMSNSKAIKLDRYWSWLVSRTVRMLAETYMRGAEKAVQMTMAADIKSGLTLY